MAESVLRIDELRQLTHLTRPADIRRKLESQSIMCFGEGETLFTTQDVITLAAKIRLGLVKPDDKGDIL